MNQIPQATTAAISTTQRASIGVLVAISLAHLLNDTLQSLLTALYPLLKEKYFLSFAQIGTITLTFQMTASMLQPIVGMYTDRRPRPFSLAIGMGSTLIGLLLLSFANTFPVILISAALIGLGSSIFHPEASRIARMASGGRHGFAQAIFQVGGNFGSATGPLLAAWIVVPRGQPVIAWFAVIALVAITILSRIGFWYRQQLEVQKLNRSNASVRPASSLPRWQVVSSIAVLVALVISKNFYTASFSSYYTFYLMDRFHLGVQTSQICLFIFLFAVAAGTIAGGPLGDRFGRKLVIWFSILGASPFALALPYVGLELTIVLTFLIGLIIASAFSAIIVYAQDLLPGNVGLVAGMFFGFAFGISGIGSAVLGQLVDKTSLSYVFWLCSFLPLTGAVAILLPNIRHINTPPQNADLDASEEGPV
ncbi:MFS transporter [Planctomicrobium sp. SH668]|uniref:MFS transporter n=1 Tax=Planctomicrobium sp. SH668 TaxID=3448126 RepID=UPI003F5C3C78